MQASQTIAGYWLPRHLVAFHRDHPGIDIRLAFGNTARVARAVHDDDADLGFIEGDIDDPLLTVELVARDQLVVVWDQSIFGPTLAASNRKVHRE